MRDEFPGQAFLTDVQVRKLFAYNDRKEWASFVESLGGFPKPVKVGKTRNGKDRMLYPKELVYAWILLHNSHQEGS